MSSSDFMPQKVLVVGGAGYIGSCLIPFLLEAELEVTVFDRLLFGDDSIKKWKNNKNFTLIEGDYTDLRAVNEVVPGHDAVILLAALVGDPACDRNPAETLAVNYLGALNLIKAARYHKVSRFLFASTDSCYGAQENISLKEDDELKPLSLYAELKAAVEKELLAQTGDPDFHPTILRLATVYGLSPRMRFDLVINLLTRAATCDGLAKIFSGEQWRPLVHVKDAAWAFCLALLSPIGKVSGEIFNVGSNRQNVQFKDLAALLLKVIPEAKIETIPQPPDLRDYNVNFDKIEKVLKFRADYELEEGIAEIKKALEAGLLGDPYQAKYCN